MTDSAQQTSSEIFDPFFLELLQNTWASEHYNLGVDLLDAQHLWLIALLQKAQQFLMRPNQPGRAIQLSKYFNDFADFLLAHTKVEELAMETTGYPKFNERTQQNKEMFDNLREIFSLNRGKEVQKPEGLLKYLQVWLKRHIKEEDSLWKLFLMQKQLDPHNHIMSILKDPISEMNSPHMALYRQLVIYKEFIPGLKKPILDDIFLLWQRFDLKMDIPLIDMQHLWLLKMVVEIESMLHVAFEERQATLEKTLTDLLIYVDVHFRSEEALMTKLDYTEFNHHRDLHETFKRQILKLKKEYDEGNHHSLSSLVTILRQWLISHIAIEDVKFAKFCGSDHKNSLDASRIVIREKEIKLQREQTLLYLYISARLRAT
jgi:hemerythrin-like metal-binding protein